MIDDEVTSLTGTIISVHGPFTDGSAEIEMQLEDGEIVVVSMDAESYAELIDAVATPMHRS